MERMIEQGYYGSKSGIIRDAVRRLFEPDLEHRVRKIVDEQLDRRLDDYVHKKDLVEILEHQERCLEDGDQPETVIGDTRQMLKNLIGYHWTPSEERLEGENSV